MQNRRLQHTLVVRSHGEISWVRITLYGPGCLQLSGALEAWAFVLRTGGIVYSVLFAHLACDVEAVFFILCHDGINVCLKSA